MTLAKFPLHRLKNPCSFGIRTKQSMMPGGRITNVNYLKNLNLDTWIEDVNAKTSYGSVIMRIIDDQTDKEIIGSHGISKVIIITHRWVFGDIAGNKGTRPRGKGTSRWQVDEIGQKHEEVKWSSSKKIGKADQGVWPLFTFILLVDCDLLRSMLNL